MNLLELPALPALWSRGMAEATRRDGPSNSALLMRMLDEIDYGLLLVGSDGRLRIANQLALQEIALDGPLRVAGERLCTEPEAEPGPLRCALADAARGRRSLVTLSQHGRRLLVAVIPIDDGCNEPLALLLFNRRSSCAELTITLYARSHGLTATESAVLLQLSQGVKPKDVARTQGVALSTVRSQILCIRGKTHTASIGDLMSRVAMLPPFASAMKTAPAASVDAAAPARRRAPAPHRAAPAYAAC